jgi:hypothetical protein
MRRYNRHKTKHAAYFEALAAGVLRDGPTTVQFGELRYVVEVQKMSFRRLWLSIRFAGGREVRGTDITNYSDQVRVIADMLMQVAGESQGVVVPPSDSDVGTPTRLRSFDEDAEIRSGLGVLGPSALHELEDVLAWPQPRRGELLRSLVGRRHLEPLAQLIALAETDNVARLRLLRALRDSGPRSA